MVPFTTCSRPAFLVCVAAPWCAAIYHARWRFELCSLGLRRFLRRYHYKLPQWDQVRLGNRARPKLCVRVYTTLVKTLELWMGDRRRHCLENVVIFTVLNTIGLKRAGSNLIISRVPLGHTYSFWCRLYWVELIFNLLFIKYCAKCETIVYPVYLNILTCTARMGYSRWYFIGEWVQYIWFRRADFWTRPEVAFNRWCFVSRRSFGLMNMIAGGPFTARHICIPCRHWL